MRILQIHTFYKHVGGEDSVLKAEKALLSDHHDVDDLLFSNEEIENKGKLNSLVSIFYSSNSYKLLIDKIDSFKPDVIHLHNLFYEASPSVLYAAQKKKIPVVLTLHNYRLICSNALLLRNGKVCELCIKNTFPTAGIKYKCFQNSTIKTALLTAVTGIHKLLSTWQNKVGQYLVFSEFQKNKLLESSLKVRESQIFIKPNFVENERPGEYKKRENYYLFIGRLSKEKGVDVLLETSSKHQFNLEIIGDGPLKEQVQKQANENNRLKYHGFQNKKFIIDKLKTAKALIFPSIWYEGMPVTMLESFSTGTPILVSDMDNIKDMVHHGVNGMHFKSGDAEALADCIVVFERQLNENFYKNAHVEFLTKYSKEKNLILLEDAYKKAINTC